MKSSVYVPSHFLTECDVCGAMYRAKSAGEYGSIGEFGCEATVKFNDYRSGSLDICDNCAAEYVAPLVNRLLEREEEKRIAQQTDETGCVPSPADDPGSIG